LFHDPPAPDIYPLSLHDALPILFASLLVNQRVREDDLLLIAGSNRASAEKLLLLAADRKWSSRYALRRALVLNPLTPRSVAASRSEEHTSELQSRGHLVCRLLLE